MKSGRAYYIDASHNCDEALSSKYLIQLKNSKLKVNACLHWSKGSIYKDLFQKSHAESLHFKMPHFTKCVCCKTSNFAIV